MYHVFFRLFCAQIFVCLPHSVSHIIVGWICNYSVCVSHKFFPLVSVTNKEKKTIFSQIIRRILWKLKMRSVLCKEFFTAQHTAACKVPVIHGYVRACRLTCFVSFTHIHTHTAFFLCRLDNCWCVDHSISRNTHTVSLSLSFSTCDPIAIESDLSRAKKHKLCVFYMKREQFYDFTWYFVIEFHLGSSCVCKAYISGAQFPLRQILLRVNVFVRPFSFNCFRFPGYDFVL